MPARGAFAKGGIPPAKWEMTIRVPHRISCSRQRREAQKIEEQRRASHPIHAAAERRISIRDRRSLRFGAIQGGARHGHALESRTAKHRPAAPICIRTRLRDEGLRHDVRQARPKFARLVARRMSRRAKLFQHNGFLLLRLDQRTWHKAHRRNGITRHGDGRSHERRARCCRRRWAFARVHVARLWPESRFLRTGSTARRAAGICRDSRTRSRRRSRRFERPRFAARSKLFRSMGNRASPNPTTSFARKACCSFSLCRIATARKLLPMHSATCCTRAAAVASTSPISSPRSIRRRTRTSANSFATG